MEQCSWLTGLSIAHVLRKSLIFSTLLFTIPQKKFSLRRAISFTLQRLVSSKKVIALNFDAVDNFHLHQVVINRGTR